MPKKNTSQVKQPVTTSQLPVISCARCTWVRAYNPAETTASAMLTEHVNRDHPELVSA